MHTTIRGRLNAASAHAVIVAAAVIAAIAATAGPRSQTLVRQAQQCLGGATDILARFLRPHMANSCG